MSDWEKVEEAVCQTGPTKPTSMPVRSDDQGCCPDIRTIYHKVRAVTCVYRLRYACSVSVT